MEKIIEILFGEEGDDEYINIVLTIIFTVMIFISGASVIYLGKREIFFKFDTSMLLLILIFIGLLIALFILAINYLAVFINGLINLKRHEKIINKIEELLKKHTVYISVASDKKDKELLEKEKDFLIKSI